MRLMLVLGVGLLTACSSSLGGSGGSAPQKTYIVMPNGQVEPAQQAPTP